MGRIRSITSRENPVVKDLRSLVSDHREIRRQGRTVLDGPHLVEAHIRHCGTPEVLVLNDAGLNNAEVAALVAACPEADVLQLPDGLFRELSGVSAPVGILAVVRIPDVPAVPLSASCVLLDAVQDSGNLGTILRTAAAAGIRDVVLGIGCAGAWTPKVMRAAQGAHYSLRMREQVALKAVLCDYPGHSVAAVARDGESVFDLDLGGDVAWIFGNEGSGISEELVSLAQTRTTIPLSADTESLNVAVAAGICLFEAVRQRERRKGG